LFSDLRDYTRFVESKGDSAAAALLREYRSIVRREVAQHAGAEVKTEGDSFYVVFSSPRAALDCAVAILKRVEAHEQRDPDLPISVAMGIHAGETVEFDDQFVGGAVIIGSRLCARAKAREILISDTFRGLVRTGQTHEMEDRGWIRLKGVDERVRAWSVRTSTATASAATEPKRSSRQSITLPVAAPSPRVSGVLACPVLVGRDKQLAAFVGYLEGTARIEMRTIVVSGEAGVGKSALMREVERLAAARGFRTLSGATLESDTGIPYAPFVAAIRSALQVVPQEEASRFLSSVAPELGYLFPEAMRAAPRRAQSGAVDRNRLTMALQWLLAALAKDAPLLLVLEDLHWADEASLALLHSLTRNRPAHSLLVATYRSDDLRDRDPLARLLVAMRREVGVTEISLPRLTSTEIAALIHETLLTLHPGAPVKDDLRDAIFGRSDGNPFFTEEILRSLVESGAISFDPSAGWHLRPAREVQIPVSVREIIHERISRLPQETRDMLAVLAVVGSAMYFDELRLITGSAEEDLERYLRLCIDEQLLVESALDGGAEYTFRHALTREVVYNDLLLPLRRRLHLRVAQRLATYPNVHPASVAPHWREGGDLEHAAAAFEAAARVDLALYAPWQAVSHIEAAITARGDASLDHYILLARAYGATDHRKARDAAEHAISLMDAEGSDDLDQRIELMQIAGVARLRSGDPDGNFSLAHAAVELVETREDRAAKARAFDWYARAHMTRGDRDAARHWSDRALAVARTVGDGETAASALTALAACAALERPAAALALAEEAADEARTTKTPPVLARAVYDACCYSFHVETGRLRYVRLERAFGVVRTYGYVRPQIEFLRAWHCLLGGDWPANGSFEIAGDPDDDMYVASIRSVEDIISCARGGPTPETIAKITALAGRAVGQNDPEFGVLLLAHEAVLLALAGRDEEVKERTRTLQTTAARAAAPDLSFTALGRGSNAPAIALALCGARDRLQRIAGSLGEAEGYLGDKLMVEAFLARMRDDDGASHDAYVAAAPMFRERGLHFTNAIDLWGLARIAPLGDTWRESITQVSVSLERMHATWLISAIQSRTTST